MKELKERRILILYTGGTIGMKPSVKLGGLSPGSMEDLQKNLPELQELPYQLEWEEFRFEGELIDSSNANIDYYNELGKKLAEQHDKYDGIVVVFGTDTMGPSAAAISYQLEGLKTPIVFTGSMEPNTKEGSDGPQNMLDAVNIAAQSGNEISAINEVTVCMHGKLFKGVHARKYSARSESRAAFDGVGEDPIAEINAEGIKINNNTIQAKDENQKFEFHELKKPDIVPIAVCSEFGGSKKSKLRVATDADAILLYDLPKEQLLGTNSQLYKDIKIIAPDKIIFFTGKTEITDPKWVRLEAVPDFLQIMAKANYVLSRANNDDEIRLLAEGNLRGEGKGPLLNEGEMLSEMRREKEVRVLDKR